MFLNNFKIDFGSPHLQLKNTKTKM